MTAFNTFLEALAKAADHDRVLGDACVEFPPSESVDYWATPKNAVVFGWLGCDGVHYAILKIGGRICDDSPVIQVGPMDFDEPYSLLAATFVDYLAIGCGSSRQLIDELIFAEKTGGASLLDFLRAHFSQARFWADDINRDIAPYRSLIAPRTNGEQDK